MFVVEKKFKRYNVCIPLLHCYVMSQYVICQLEKSSVSENRICHLTVAADNCHIHWSSMSFDSYSRKSSHYLVVIIRSTTVEVFYIIVCHLTVAADKSYLDFWYGIWQLQLTIVALVVAVLVLTVQLKHYYSTYYEVPGTDMFLLYVYSNRNNCTVYRER